MIFVTTDDNDGTSDDIFWKVKIIEIAEAGRATRVEAKCEIQWRCFSIVMTIVMTMEGNHCCKSLLHVYVWRWGGMGVGEVEEAISHAR